MKLTISDRERWGVKWHLNGQPMPDRISRRRLDKLWDALKLDEITAPVMADPETFSNAPTEFELTSDERDSLIDWMNTPMNGRLSRLLSGLDRDLIKSRDG